MPNISKGALKQLRELMLQAGHGPNRPGQRYVPLDVVREEYGGALPQHRFLESFGTGLDSSAGATDLSTYRLPAGLLGVSPGGEAQNAMPWIVRARNRGQQPTRKDVLREYLKSLLEGGSFEDLSGGGFGGWD